MSSKSLRSIYQLKVILKGSQPPIWRRFQIASSDDLEDLHIVLQIVMGWENEHLHEFSQGRTRYGLPDEDFPSDILHENDYRIDQVLKKEKDKLIYDYDFGDGWQHEVILEKILPFDTEVILPHCIKGKRACPPEDIGGIGGYEMLLKTLANPSDPDYEETLEWIGGPIDAEYFSVTDVNNIFIEYENDTGQELVTDFEDISDENKFEFLDEFLLSRIDEDELEEDSDKGILGLSELHGFFTAIISGPTLIQPSKWLPVVWGDFEPEWETPEEFEAVFSLMIEIMNSIVIPLMSNPKEFEPLYDYRNFKNKTFIIVDEWCEGYVRGISLENNAWELDSLDMTILLTPILAFTSETQWEGHQLSQDEAENIKKAIPENARKIHAYWLAHRSQEDYSPQPVHHSEPKTGRNDPCPCGSGKKYKKCCLH